MLDTHTKRIINTIFRIILTSYQNTHFKYLINCSATEVDKVIWTNEKEASLLTPAEQKVAFR